MKLKYLKYLEKGMKFGRLTVLEVDENSKIKNGINVIPNKWKYKCQCECSNIVYVTKNNLCNKHTQSCGCLNIERIKKANKKINRIEVNGDITKIFFFNVNKYTIIDTKDYDKIKDYCWCIDFYGYVLTHKKYHVIRMHRLLTNTPNDKVVDHINGNPLDNRKCNLRICTQVGNAQNTKLSKSNSSGYKGVYWVKTRNKWMALIKLNYKSKYLGQFENIEDAIKAREKAEIKYFGEFRRKVS